jgi:DNA repair exonuclease SbcCD ATPase subunit
MPPKGSKRAAATAAGGVEKAAKKAASSKCATVVAQMKTFEAFPKACRTMLASIADSILTTYAADRHPFQVQALEMFAQTVAMIEADLEKKVSEAQAAVENSGTDHAAHQAAVTAAEAKLAGSSEEVTKLKENLAASASSEKDAKAALVSAQAGLQAKKDELESEGSKKKDLESAKESYEELKASTQVGKDGRTSLKTLIKVLKDFGLEDTVVDALSEVLLKDPAKLGTFDKIVLEQVDAKFPEWAASVESSIKACESLLEELPKSVADAEQQCAARADDSKTLREALDTATAAASEAKTEVKEVSATLKAFEKTMPALESDLEEAKAALSSFKEGPAQAFDELKTLAAPKPVPDPVPEEPVLAETAPEEKAPEETPAAVPEAGA